MVIAFHTGTVFSRNPFSSGYLGVDLFFVLSGFLITGILVKSRDSLAFPAYLKTFYWRRSLRIFPAYYVYLGVAFVIITVGRYHRANFLPYIFYFQNFHTAHSEYFLTHLWSLAVEEQFYLVWPFIVWFAPRRWLGLFCGVVALAALGARFAHSPVARLHLEALCAGAWLAGVPQTLRIISLAPPLRWRPLRAIGTYSYGMYLYHFVPFLLLIGWATRLPFAARLLFVPAVTAISFGIAMVSSRLVERPFMALRAAPAVATIPIDSHHRAASAGVGF